MSEPERWRVDAADRAIARLDVPPHASREREFEIDVRFVVKAGAGRQPQHGLRVLVNGAQEWARRLPTQRDGIRPRNFHCCTVPLRASSAVDEAFSPPSRSKSSATVTIGMSTVQVMPPSITQNVMTSQDTKRQWSARPVRRHP